MSTIESPPALSMGVRGAVDWYDDRWYVTPFSNSLGPDKSRNARGSGLFPLLFSGKSTGSSGGLALGKSVSPEWNVELRAGWDDMDARNYSRSRKNWFNEFHTWSIGIDVQWFFLDRLGRDRAYVVQPYVVAGVGVINDKASSTIAYGDGQASSFMASAGFGVVWPFSSWGRLVVDVRERYDANRAHLARHNTKFDDKLWSFGLQIPLGSVPEVAPLKRPSEPMAPPIAMPLPPFRVTQP